ncbi:MAG: lamin tail domain-containing protein [candidate division WOR-3 bacterium]
MNFIYFSVLIFNLWSRLVINEVMSNPRGRTGVGYPEDRNEFVELYNISAETVDIRGWRLTDFDATDSIIAWFDSTIYNYYPGVIINTTRIPPYSYALILDQEYLSGAIGGYFAPYWFPDSLIILTVGNTTIGNELQTNDPLLLYSSEGDSSSFGTPFDSDSFPYDVGDGISWERVAMELEDYPCNWYATLDSSGSSPGRENSIYNFYDLAIVKISAPSQVAVDSLVNILMTIKNTGYRVAYSWRVVFFVDQNRNQAEDFGERITERWGLGLDINAETTLSVLWRASSSGEYPVAGLINYPEDRRSDNNYRMIVIRAGLRPQTIWLSKNSFSPDNDLTDDSLFIYYQFNAPQGKLLCLVYDLNGRKVRKLKDQKIFDGIGTISWDGKSDNHLNLPTGIYIIYVEYKPTNQPAVTKKIPVSLIRKL